MTKLTNLDSQTDQRSAKNNQLSIASAPEAALLAKEDPSSIALASKGTLPSPSVASCSNPQSAIRNPQSRKLRRKGRIACLPKLQRDMVNHMLWNGIPYKNIVAALDEAGFTVTERNVSNWATGGYLEWSLAQEHILQNRLDQDHMLDFLRRDDAPELPEVGLQAAATRLSQVLLQKLARADDPEAHLDNYSRLVDLLVRLNREIGATQKQRDDSRRTLGREYDPVLVKDEEQVEAIENERFYSNPPSDSTLSGPSVPPALPPIPTATLMARQTREERADEEAARRKSNLELWKACLAGTAPAPKQIESTPSRPALGAPERTEAGLGVPELPEGGPAASNAPRLPRRNVVQAGSDAPRPDDRNPTTGRCTVGPGRLW